MDFFHLNLEILNVNKSFVYALLYFSRNFSGFSLKSSNSVSFQAMKMFFFFLNGAEFCQKLIGMVIFRCRTSKKEYGWQF